MEKMIFRHPDYMFHFTIRQAAADDHRVEFVPADDGSGNHTIHPSGLFNYIMQVQKEGWNLVRE